MCALLRRRIRPRRSWCADATDGARDSEAYVDVFLRQIDCGIQQSLVYSGQGASDGEWRNVNSSRPHATKLELTLSRMACMVQSISRQENFTWTAVEWQHPRSGGSLTP